MGLICLSEDSTTRRHLPSRSFRGIAGLKHTSPALKASCSRMGFIRFFLLVTLIQFMAALPIKMILRWTINLKYIVYIPEFFFNI